METYLFFLGRYLCNKVRLPNVLRKVTVSTKSMNFIAALRVSRILYESSPLKSSTDLVTQTRVLKNTQRKYEMLPNATKFTPEMYLLLNDYKHYVT